MFLEKNMSLSKFLKSSVAVTLVCSILNGTLPAYSKSFPTQDKGTTATGNASTLSTAGGETHQQSGGDLPTMTTELGCPVSDNQNSLKAGTRGPTLIEDFAAREKIFHFDHERIPERVVHARGYGVHGYFENYKSLGNVTKADLFQRAGEKTPVFVRFSTVIGNKGSMDLARDVRGFATKFYTKEGNWDLVGNNIPVFFIQDALKFPDLIHAAKPEPDKDIPQAQTAHDNFWDFISLMPESMHMIMWVMSDRAIPRSYRFMEGFGVNTFKLVNDAGQMRFVKFHWKPKQGLQSVLWNEAVKINGADPDFHRRDLWDSINAGNFPEWELGMQIVDEEFAKKFDFDILDDTKLIPEELVPVQRVGRLVLNKTPDNFFAETEQVAFCTQNVVPGIDFSDDPMLQLRNFSYLDTQLKRLGSPNFTQLPINAPKCPVFNFQQDGHMTFVNPKGRVNYEPNSWGGPRENKNSGFTTNPQTAATATKVRMRSETFADHYSQARQFYISQTPIEQKHIADALVFELSRCEKESVRTKMVSHLANIDGDLAAKVAKGLGMTNLPPQAKTANSAKDLPASPALSIINNGPKSFKDRRLGILLSDGVDHKAVAALVDAATKEGAEVRIVAPTIAGVKADDGSVIKADFKIDGGPSVLFDAVAVLVTADGAERLLAEPTAKDFVSDAYNHLKIIGFNQNSKPLFQSVGVNVDAPEPGLVALDSQSNAASFIATCRKIRIWDRELKVKNSDKANSRPKS